MEEGDEQLKATWLSGPQHIQPKPANSGIYEQEHHSSGGFDCSD